jgi:hypothetical protein
VLGGGIAFETPNAEHDREPAKSDATFNTL